MEKIIDPISREILKKELSKVATTSEKISNNFGTKAFSGLADITKSIPGLRSFSAPFENAAEAAREQAEIAEIKKEIDIVNDKLSKL